MSRTQHRIVIPSDLNQGLVILSGAWPKRSAGRAQSKDLCVPAFSTDPAKHSPAAAVALPLRQRPN